MASGSCSYDDCGRSSLGADGFSLVGDEMSDDNDGTVFDNVLSGDGVAIMPQSDESYDYGSVPVTTSIDAGGTPEARLMADQPKVNSIDQAVLSMPNDISIGINDSEEAQDRTLRLEASAESRLYHLICIDKEEQNKVTSRVVSGTAVSC